MRCVDGCPDNTWTIYNEHCYKLFKQPKNWASSLQHCRLFSGYLVRIQNNNENSFIANLVAGHLSNTFPTWISANDIDIGKYPRN